MLCILMNNQDLFYFILFDSINLGERIRSRVSFFFLFSFFFLTKKKRKWKKEEELNWTGKIACLLWNVN